MKITAEMIKAASDDANRQQLGVMYQAMKAERDALAAQVEALQSRLSTAERVERIFNEAQDLSFDDCLNLFPEEIREIQAEAGRAGYIAGMYDYEQVVEIDRYNSPEKAADEYAAKVRQGVNNEK